LLPAPSAAPAATANSITHSADHVGA
jgi:hypothetical protein